MFWVAAQSGHALASVFKQGGAVGVDGLFEPCGAGLACAQGRQGIAEVVLGRRPIQRHALASVFQQGGAVGVDGLFEPCGAGLARAEGLENNAEVVLGRRPVQRHALAGSLQQGGAVGVDGVHERRIVAELIALGVEGACSAQAKLAGLLRVQAPEETGGIGVVLGRDQIIEVQVSGFGARREKFGGGPLLDLGLGGQRPRGGDLEAGGVSEKAMRLLEVAAVDRIARGGLGRDDLRVVGEQALPAGLQREVFVRLRFQALPQFAGIVRQGSHLAEPAQDSMQDVERDTLVRSNGCFKAAEAAQKLFQISSGFVLLLVQPRHTRRRLRRQVRQQPLAALRVGQDGAVGGFDEATAEVAEAAIDCAVGGAVMGEAGRGRFQEVVGYQNTDSLPGVDVAAQAGRPEAGGELVLGRAEAPQDVLRRLDGCLGVLRVQAGLAGEDGGEFGVDRFRQRTLLRVRPLVEHRTDTADQVVDGHVLVDGIIDQLAERDAGDGGDRVQGQGVAPRVADVGLSVFTCPEDGRSCQCIGRFGSVPARLVPI